MPLLKPCGDVPLGLLQGAPVIDPTQFRHAVIVRLAGQIVERITQEMYVTTLPHRLGKRFTDGLLEPFMVITDDELHVA